VLDKKENKHTAVLGGGNVSTFDYTVNGIGQRTAIAATGAAFTEGAPTINVGYNTKGEVVNVDHSNNTFDKSYDFDGIGNRKTSTEDGATTNYTVNALNQYTAVGVAAQSYDEDGNTLTTRLPVDPNNDATLEWNGNNSLTKVTLADGTEVFSEYDFKGRRFREVITTGAASTYKYWIYDGWNPIAEYTRKASDNEAQVSKTFYWGKEITGNLGDAGGVGGLLAEYQHGTSTEGFFPLQDGNGNVTEYLDSTGAVAAHYQYDSFGKTLVQSGAKADSFSHRFSTVYYKTETGLYDYGLRMMNVNTGRFENRDPIREKGGVNIYGFVGNDGVNRWDYMGLDSRKIHGISERPSNVCIEPYDPKKGILYWYRYEGGVLKTLERVKNPEKVARGKTVNIFINGIRNEPENAAFNARDKMKRDFGFFIHNPTQGGLVDGIEVMQGKLTGTSKISRSVAELLEKMKIDYKTSKIWAHSQGGVIATNAVRSLGKRVKIDGLTVYYSNAAVNKYVATGILKKFHVKVGQFNTNSADAVSEIIGMNALTSGKVHRIPVALISVPFLFTNRKYSPHSTEAGAVKGPVVWFQKMP